MGCPAWNYPQPLLPSRGSSTCTTRALCGAGVQGLELLPDPILGCGVASCPSAAGHCREGWMLSLFFTRSSAWEGQKQQHIEETALGLQARCCARSTSDRPSHQGGQPRHSTSHYFLSICNPSFSIKFPSCSKEKGLHFHLLYPRPFLWDFSPEESSVYTYLSWTTWNLFCCALITPFHSIDIIACCFLP